MAGRATLRRARWRRLRLAGSYALGGPSRRLRRLPERRRPPASCASRRPCRKTQHDRLGIGDAGSARAGAGAPERAATPVDERLLDLQFALERLSAAAYGRNGVASDSDLDEALDAGIAPCGTSHGDHLARPRARAARQSVDRAAGSGVGTLTGIAGLVAVALDRSGSGHGRELAFPARRYRSPRARRPRRPGRRDARPSLDRPAPIAPSSVWGCPRSSRRSSRRRWLHPARSAAAARGGAAVVCAGARRSLLGARQRQRPSRAAASA